jgi:uracil-DNA glycosylase family 4
MNEQKWNLIQVRDEVRACTNCELSTKVTSPVASTGPVPCEYIVLGEAPGKIEDYKGIPFAGPAGRQLRTLLRRHRLDPDKAQYINVVSCWPGGTPNQTHLKACRHNLEIQLMAACCDKILVCGRTALRELIPHAELKWSQGSCIQIHGFDCMIMWHPSFLLQSKSKKVEADMHLTLQMFKWILTGVIPSDWGRVEWCIYCGSTLLIGDSPACSTHQSTWRQDQKWTPPTQMNLDLFGEKE